jgi:hypothetical protein
MPVNLDNINHELKEFIEEEGRDIKFKRGDIILPINYDCSPSISYDYLLLHSSEYSFLNPEINRITSKKFPGLSDSQIYFQQINKICNRKFSGLERDRFLFKSISPNRKLKEIVNFIFSQKLTTEQTPSFIEIILYTEEDKAPRIFGFIGNLNIIYILCYDPFHQIYNEVGKI